MPVDQSHQQPQPELQQQWQSNQQQYYEKWQQNYRQRIDSDLLARVFLCTNLCQQTFEYIMRFLHQKYEKLEALQVPMEIFDVIFETEAGKRSHKRPPRPIEPCEKVILFICLVKQYPELTNAIVKESGKDSREFFNNQTEDAPPEKSIVDWLLHQSWNETNIFDILQIAAQTAQTAYFAHGLPFALMRDKNPRYQVQEYTDNTGKLKSLVPDDEEGDDGDGDGDGDTVMKSTGGSDNVDIKME
jgi:hypothetical protein